MRIPYASGLNIKEILKITKLYLFCGVIEIVKKRDFIGTDK
jgi:hypothetical protein